MKIDFKQIKHKIIAFFERLLYAPMTEEEKQRWEKDKKELQALLDRIKNDPELQETIRQAEKLQEEESKRIWPSCGL